jgi:hypothetical protein
MQALALLWGTMSNQVITYGKVPNTLLAACNKHADKIREVGHEGEDGYWIYLRDGFWNPLDEVVAIHEYTVSDCLRMIRNIHPDPRPANQR